LVVVVVVLNRINPSQTRHDAKGKGMFFFHYKVETWQI
jgi:hypothetical protein